MTVGSLFTGIGGLDLALEHFGHRVIWQAESDGHARAVLAKHWPGVRCFEDVREIDATSPPPDIICGGFPCQDISNAGKRVGIDGERSGLWSEFARIIRELRPRLVFVENVAALTVRGLDRVLGDLAALGFDAEWDVLRAADVGAPHLRARIFILAHANGVDGWVQPGRWAGPCRSDPTVSADDGAPRHVADASCGGQRQGEWDVCPRQPDADRRGTPLADADEHGLAIERRSQRERGEARIDPPRDVADGRDSEIRDSDGAGREGTWTQPKAGWLSSFGEHAGWAVEPPVGRVAHGVPRRVDRLRCLGNAVVWQQAAFAFETLSARAGINCEDM